MRDQEKTREALVAELEILRSRLAAAENTQQRNRAVRQAEEDWAGTFDAMPDLIAIIDGQFQIRRVNQAMAGRLGVAPDDLVGRKCYEVLHGGEAPPRFCPHLKTLTDCQMHAAEVCEDVLKGDFQVTTSPLFDSQGNVTGSVHVARDITRRRQIEKALRESEAKFRGITERSFDAICLMDLEGYATYVSPAGEKILRTKAQELIGRHFCEFIQEPHIAEGMQAFDRVVEGGSSDLIETKLRAADGTIVHLEVCASMILSDGGPVGVQVIARDVTQRNEVDEELRRMQAQLAHTARLTAMGEMVASIAHEVNQPLFSILNFAKAVRNLLAVDGPLQIDKLREWNEDIALAATRAGEIITRLRHFVRRTDGQREAIRVEKLVEESVAIVAYELREHCIDVSVSCEGNETMVAADRVQIQQVLVNLLRNACESMEEEKNSEPRIVICISAGDGAVEVSVSDNGPGVPADRIPKLFRPFFTTKQNGLGMGLAIGKTIIESHGGLLWADDHRGPGATFRFSLPLRKANIAYQEHANVE